jgi:hypothetical protein
MVVRVKVRITDGGKSVVVKVLVNGGAESDEPLVVVDLDIASKLGISSEELDVIEVELASGTTHNYITRRKYLVELLDDNITLSSTYAYIAVDPYLTEPLITDATIDELGIQVISFKRGLWRHVKDPIDKIRRSAGNLNDTPETYSETW